MGSCSLRLHAPQQVSLSAHLSGLALDAHRCIGKEKMTSETKGKTHCRSAAAGLAAVLLKYNARGFFPTVYGMRAENRKFLISPIFSTVLKKYGS